MCCCSWQGKADHHRTTRRRYARKCPCRVELRARRAADLGLEPEFYQNIDIHMHFPEGAIPKDGPSAGVTMATALVSALCKIDVRHDVAMTGEITLRGRVLPIGGLREKTLAAKRGGIKTVIIPEENRKDIKDIPEKIRKAITDLYPSSMSMKCSTWHCNTAENCGRATCPRRWTKLLDHHSTPRRPPRA